jgi:hypothetical protein
MYLNVYFGPRQQEGGVASLFRFHRGHQFASSVLMDRISKTFIAAMGAFARRQSVPIVQFRKRQRENNIAGEYLKKFTNSEGVLFIGNAQEKTPVFRTERRRNEKTGVTYPWLVRSTAMVNHLYVYCVDRDFGPFFLKFSTYFPYNAKLCLNGPEYAKRQLEHKGIGFEGWITEWLRCDDPPRLQAICDGLSADKIDALLGKVTQASTSIHDRGPPCGLPISAFHPASGVLAHSGAGSHADGLRVFRGSHPGESRHRPAWSGTAYG